MSKGQAIPGICPFTQLLKVLPEISPKHCLESKYAYGTQKVHAKDVAPSPEKSQRFSE